MVDHYSVLSEGNHTEGNVTFNLETGGSDLDMVCLLYREYIKVTSKLGQVSAKRSFKFRSLCSDRIGLPQVSTLLLFPELVEITTERYYKCKLLMSITK